jgi:cobalamin biosynthesis Co2+ chelatase CbiK
MKRVSTPFRVHRFSDGWVACHPAIFRMFSSHVVTLAFPVRKSRRNLRTQDGKFGRTPYEALERLKREMSLQGLRA